LTRSAVDHPHSRKAQSRIADAPALQVPHCIVHLVERVLDTVTLDDEILGQRHGRKNRRSRLQLFSGYGYMDEYPISRLYRDSRVLRIYAGTNETMKLVIARSL
jgi:acyl-CoA dehydrogenase